MDSGKESMVTPIDALGEPSIQTNPVTSSSRNFLIKSIIGLVALLLLFTGCNLLPLTQLNVVGSTIISLPLTIWLVICLAGTLQNIRHLIVFTFIIMVSFLPMVLIPILAETYPRLPWKKTAFLTHPYFTILTAVPGLRTILIICGAACLAVWLSRMVKEMKILLPIAAALFLMDIYVVFGGGLVTQAVHTPASKPSVAKVAMHALTAPLPSVKSSTLHAAPINVVGFADFLFIGFFFSCFYRFKTDPNKVRATFIILSVVLLLYMALTYLVLALPALVPISVIVVGMNLREFRYTRSEAFALLYVGMLMLAILGFMVLHSLGDIG